MSESNLKPLVLGTRRSALALEQSKTVRLELEAQGIGVEVSEIVTSGDMKQNSGEGVVRDKKDWIIEIEAALVTNEIDLAVHSAKDVPVAIEPSTVLVPVLPRACANDVLLCKSAPLHSLSRSGGAMLAELPAGATIGTASLRRSSQLHRLRSDLVLKPLRGNVTTRLEKLKREPGWDAIVLACAGLERLALTRELFSLFLPSELVPAVHQGILAVQYRKDDQRVGSIIRRLVHPPTELAWRAERACITALGADCGSAVGVYASVEGSALEMHGRVLDATGERCLDAMIRGEIADCEVLGRALADDLFSKGAKELL